MPTGAVNRTGPNPNQPEVPDSKSGFCARLGWAKSGRVAKKKAVMIAGQWIFDLIGDTQAARTEVRAGLSTRRRDAGATLNNSITLRFGCTVRLRSRSGVRAGPDSDRATSYGPGP